MKKPEILAPAGTFEALKAAVSAGADAVYVGGSMFSARAFAGNFDKEELLRAIDYCHFFDVKIYLAVNTLLKEDEIQSLAGYIEPFYKEGIDAVIVQDMGVSSVLARSFPDLPLHASTQMSVTSSYGAAFLKSLGFTRIVPARELSLEEISEIKKNVDIEIEAFVHGAMCYCYSGKCMFSSFSGGRSGNRGRCAQPCRKKYEYNGKEEYIMSLRDMCTLEIVPELIKAGTDSFKIEGRMKKSEYVACAVRAYRKAADAYCEGKWDNEMIAGYTDEMKDIYNRGGFSQGYYFSRPGSSMLAAERPNHEGLKVGTVKRISPPLVYIALEKDVNEHDVVEIRPGAVELTSAKAAKAGEILEINGNNFGKIKPGMEVYRTRNNRLIGEITENIINKESTVRAKAFVRARTGQPLSITVSDEAVQVCAEGKIVQAAKKCATSKQAVIEKMKKTTGTLIRLDVECEIDADAFVPMSELNELRRRAAEEFKEKRSGRFRRGV